MGPWATPTGPQKTAQNQLIDVLTHVPGFLQDQELFARTGDTSVRQDLVDRIERQLSILYGWRYKWEQENRNAACERDMVPEFPLLGLIHSRPFQKVLVCADWRQATEISCYNAVILSLLGILWSLQASKSFSHGQSSDTLGPLQSPLLLPNQISSLEQVAVEICRVFEYQLATVSKSPALCLRRERQAGSCSPELSVRPASSSSAEDDVRVSAVIGGVWTKLWPNLPLA